MGLVYCQPIFLHHHGGYKCLGTKEEAGDRQPIDHFINSHILHDFSEDNNFCIFGGNHFDFSNKALLFITGNMLKFSASVPQVIDRFVQYLLRP